MLTPVHRRHSAQQRFLRLLLAPLVVSLALGGRGPMEVVAGITPAAPFDSSVCDIAPRTALPPFDRSGGSRELILGTDSEASQEVIEEITRTVTMMVACLNAGETGSYLSFYSDDFLREGRFQVSASDLLAAPEPLAPEEQVSLLGVFFVRQYQDGRVGAIVAMSEPDIQSPVSPLFLIFVRKGDRWLIDFWPDPFSTIQE
jgi:hypothetical protein